MAGAEQRVSRRRRDRCKGAAPVSAQRERAIIPRAASVQRGSGSMATGGSSVGVQASRAHCQKSASDALAAGGGGWARNSHARASAESRSMRVERRRAGLLGQLLAAGIDHHRMVQVRRRAKSERALQGDLARRRGQQVGAAHDVADALRRVVDHHRELIGEHAVGALDDEIADVALEALLLSALQAVVKADRLRVHAQPPGRRAGWRRGGAAAGARIDALAGGAERRARQLPPGAGAGEHQAALHELVECRLVELAALALVDDRAVPLEAMGFEGGANVGTDMAAAARRVDVLDAQQPFAAGGAGVAAARQRGDERAEMQRPGRRGREAAAVTRRGLHSRVLAPTRAGAGSIAPAGCGFHSQWRMDASTAVG